MRKNIHPTYHADAKVTCACGSTWTTGSTEPELRVYICSDCHPFFTGEQRIVDTAGRVDRFMDRLNRYSTHQQDATKRKGKALAKQEQKFAKQQIAVLDLNDRVQQALHDENIVTLGDLAKRLDNNRDDILAITGVTPEIVDELDTKLADARATFFAEPA
ncbi:MAG: 50S ribosomal protein L31 [Okeania sp. SIO3B3]|nr:50S ribosomal protein L31 [Okeania sp. SIO3B3]